jgi:hypothetical protein
LVATILVQSADLSSASTLTPEQRLIYPSITALPLGSDQKAANHRTKTSSIIALLTGIARFSEAE